MEYQQATKSWFIGFLEGEGCFISERKHLDNNKQQCQIRISNTEIDLIIVCKDYLIKNMIHSYILTSKRGKNKPLHELYISGSRDCKILYELIGNDMECRSKEFDRIMGASTTTRETSCDLMWLVGAYEAEGCFTISTQSHKKGNISHKPEIIFENTNSLMVAKVVKTLYSLGLSWYVQNRVPENPSHRPSQVIKVIGFKRVSRFLRIISGFLGKKTQRKISLLNEFCQSRLSKGEKEPYSIREHQIAYEIKMKI